MFSSSNSFSAFQTFTSFKRSLVSSFVLALGLSFGVLSGLTLIGCAAKAPSDPIGSLPANVAHAGGHEAVYDYSSIVMPELWILTKPPLEHEVRLVRVFEKQTLPWIQLDGIRYPFGSLQNKQGYREAISPLFTLLNENLREYEQFRFVRTSWAMAGPHQLGGVVYLDKHLTLQGILLRRGLACVDQRRIYKPRLEATFNPDLVEFWLECESEARRKKRGFWKTHPQEMEAISQSLPAAVTVDQPAQGSEK